RDAVEHAAVDAVVVAEGGKAGERPAEETGEDGAGREEEARPHAEAHRRSSRRRTVRIAIVSTSGAAALPTVIAESATSGAWKTRKRTTSNSPKNAFTSA